MHHHTPFYLALFWGAAIPLTHALANRAAQAPEPPLITPAPLPPLQARDDHGIVGWISDLKSDIFGGSFSLKTQCASSIWSYLSDHPEPRSNSALEDFLFTRHASTFLHIPDIGSKPTDLCRYNGADILATTEASSVSVPATLTSALSSYRSAVSGWISTAAPTMSSIATRCYSVHSDTVGAGQALALVATNFDSCVTALEILSGDRSFGGPTGTANGGGNAGGSGAQGTTTRSGNGVAARPTGVVLGAVAAAAAGVAIMGAAV
ncbi:hypothetical protein QBC43DRAFT_306558 [Cladorrhinum sp. PSN259]|nr:hypothetical protein QBC43DRAFT_306558 [Cladorrhinum sp. PSN259]